jgi:hypothetical protein
VPPVRGVVLETFGSGNAPQRNDLMNALREACERGVVIVAITQCAKGSVSDAYETGRKLLQAGVVAGGDMTPEVRFPPSPPLPHRQTKKKRKKKVPLSPMIPDKVKHGFSFFDSVPSPNSAISSPNLSSPSSKCAAWSVHHCVAN